ncbi:hypothetical protein [Roseomonas chloroacetimidivorans]|uniref:hypothetical protein n=1 Tax=Roseomonas chloroacetimidivorans TaxID=1766656 RepID=UPI003C792AF9
MAGLEAGSRAAVRAERRPVGPTSESVQVQVRQVSEVHEGSLTRSQRESMDAALTALDGLQAALAMNRELLDAGRDFMRRQQDMMLDATGRMMRLWAEPTRLGCKALDGIGARAVNANACQLRPETANLAVEEDGKREALH